MSIVILSMVLLATMAFVLAPFFRRAEDASAAPGPAPGVTELADALSRRDATYEALADLEQDRAAGKLSDDDYAAMKGAYQKEAIAALRELDRLGATTDAKSTT
ncbi:MAG: hypothetical protein ACE5IK_07490 [Acidobacteriota bacterium]